MRQIAKYIVSGFFSQNAMLMIAHNFVLYNLFKIEARSKRDVRLQELALFVKYSYLTWS